MLLGKLSPDVTVDDVTDILQTVSVKQDANWWCHDWILEAIPVSTANNIREISTQLFCRLQVLVSKGIIPQLPDTPEKVWEVGYNFVEEHTDGYLSRDQPVPTCNIAGKKMSSEIGPVEG